MSNLKMVSDTIELGKPRKVTINKKSKKEGNKNEKINHKKSK